MGVNIDPFFDSEQYTRIRNFINAEYQLGVNIFPNIEDIFNAFLYTPFSKVKVVLIGQDPYPTKGDAHGLAFSCLTKTPASLRVIFKELKRTHDIDRSHNLSDWASQGVLLINQVLTVREGAAGSHKKAGWQELTKHVIQLLSEQKEGLVFMLFGAEAQSYIPYIKESEKHCILAVDHPAASLYGGKGKIPFIGSNIFLEADNYLKENKINW